MDAAPSCPPPLPSQIEEISSRILPKCKPVSRQIFFFALVVILNVVFFSEYTIPISNPIFNNDEATQLNLRRGFVAEMKERGVDRTIAD